MTEAPEWQRRAAEGIAKAEKKPRNNKPPVRYGSHGAGAGDGWGGPAKGAGAGPEALIPAQPAEKVARSAEKVRDRQERTEHMEDMLFDLAMEADRQETQITAAKALHAMYNGTPIARSITAQVDDVSQLRDDELRDELARLERARIAAGEGTAPKGMSH